MKQRYWRGTAGLIAMLVLSLALCGIAAAAEPEYSTTYTVTIVDDGSALWRVEYRTLLTSDQDSADFETYTRDIQDVYLPQFRELMERSAAQASVATGRHMAISDVTGTAAVQTSPTGKYGVVVYSLRWNGFTGPGQKMVIGDAFAGGLYLAKGNTLIIRYPDGFSVQAAEPAPDADRDGLTWYGQRSFGAGEPRIVLEQAGIPLIPAAAALVLVVGIAFAVFFFSHRKKQGGGIEGEDPAPVPLTEEEIVSLEERIRLLLKSQNNEMFQSEIVRSLGLPKSTVSSALNDMHARRLIVKVKKGRENLIRLL
jgi:hypothetical protein